MEKRDDWRARMAVRGGAVSHAIARVGWVAFAMVGVLAMIGLPAQFAVRSWLRSPTEAERQAVRAVPQGHGLRADGRWAHLYEIGARSVDAYHQAVTPLPDDAGRDPPDARHHHRTLSR